MNKTTTSETDSIARLRSAIEAQKNPQRRQAELRQQMREVSRYDLDQLKKTDPKAYGQVFSQIMQIQAEQSIVEAQSVDANLEIDAVAPFILASIAEMDNELSRIREECLGIVTREISKKLEALRIFDQEKLPRLAHESVPVRRERAFWGKFESLPSPSVNCYITGPNTPDAVEVESPPALLNAYEARAAALVEARDHRNELR